MSKRRKSLGKGLDALLGDDALESLTTTSKDSVTDQADTSGSQTGDKVIEIDIASIQPGPWQPRRQFNQQALQELADSIQSKGMLQPVLVCKWEEGYALIAGERRWRACQIAGKTKIPALVRQSDEVDNRLIALIENLQRDNLNPLEIAQAMEDLQKHKLNHQQIASALGIARSSVTNTMRLLGLPESIRNMMNEGVIEMGHARALLALDEDKQLVVAREISKRSLSVRQTEQLVQQTKQPKSKQQAELVDHDIASLSRQLGEHLTASVEIRHTPKGKGELRIKYASAKQFDELVEKLAPGLIESLNDSE